jgi:hypothetical protein
VNVNDVEEPDPAHQGPQPKRVFVASNQWNGAHCFADSPNRTGVVRQSRIKILLCGRETKHVSLNSTAHPAVHFIGPARQGSAVIRTKLLAAREKYCYSLH